MFRSNTASLNLACTVLLVGGCFCAGCNSSSNNGTSTSHMPASSTAATGTPNSSGSQPDPKQLDSKVEEARKFFVEDFWNKRFTKCSDGWYKARIDTKNYYFKYGAPHTGWLAVKGEPQDWKLDVGVPTEADKLRGITWYAEITLAPSASIAFVDGSPLGRRWENYCDGWVAMMLADLSADSTQFESEYKQIYLQVFYNTKTTPHWNVEVSPRYDATNEIFVRSWLIYGAKPANCAEFPQMP